MGEAAKVVLPSSLNLHAPLQQCLNKFPLEEGFVSSIYIFCHFKQTLLYGSRPEFPLPVPLTRVWDPGPEGLE